MQGPGSPSLLHLVIEDGAESGEGDRIDAVVVSPHHRRRHGQRVKNGFFCGFDRRCDQWIQMSVGEVRLLKRRFFWVVGNRR